MINLNKFDDETYTLSRMETSLVKDLLAVAKQHSTLVVEGKEKEMAEAYGMSERELTEFRTKFEI
jgi:hypothetical protein